MHAADEQLSLTVGCRHLNLRISCVFMIVEALLSRDSALQQALLLLQPPGWQ